MWTIERYAKWRLRRLLKMSADCYLYHWLSGFGKGLSSQGIMLPRSGKSYCTYPAADRLPK